MKKILKFVLIVIAALAGFSLLSRYIKGKNDNSQTSTSTSTALVDTRTGLYKMNLRTDVKGSALNNTTLISYLNDSSSEQPIFKDVAFIYESASQTGGTSVDSDSPDIPAAPDDAPQTKYLLEYVFKDNGGMKLGTSNNLGSFTVNLFDTFTFNRVKIIGRNYSAVNSVTGIYSCDSSSISVNNAEYQAFGTNADDTTQEAPTEEKIFEFNENQTQLSIAVAGKRATIFGIELWTESEAI